MEKLTREEKIAWVKDARQLYVMNRYSGACWALRHTYPTHWSSPKYNPYSHMYGVREITKPYKPKGLSHNKFWWDRHNWKVRRDMFDCILAGLERNYLKYFYLRVKIAWCYKVRKFF